VLAGCLRNGWRRRTEGRRVPLYGAGANVRDWLYVLDNVRAQWLVLTEGEPGGIYNVGAGNEMSNLELTERILDRMGAGEEMITYVPDRPGHDLRYSVDTTRIGWLGWAPQHSFEEALDRTIDWYRANERWWRPLKADAYASRTA
jgi:dTDP-glucose 4,6-dehydratase